MDKTTPEISVIIPTYNVAAYIEKAIHSALSQTGVSIEVIVIDDQSTDDTVAVIRKINDPRLKIIERPQNGGPSMARNKGITLATGQWIAILDGDDIFEDGRLDRLLKYAHQFHADIVVDNLNIYRETDHATFPMFTSCEFRSPTVIDLARFIRGNQFFLGGYTLGYLKPLFRSQFLKDHHLLYSTDIRIGEDYLFMAECLAKGAICITCPQSGYRYTVRAHSISHRLDSESVKRIQAADQYFLSKYPLTGAALSAQRTREQNLKSAYYFTELVIALKKKRLPDIMSIFLQHPACIFYLWRPVMARLQKMTK